MNIENSLAQIDEIRTLCEAQRARLAGMERSGRARSDAMGVLMLAEDALKIQLDIHKLLLRLASRDTPAEPPKSNVTRFAPHPLRRASVSGRAGGATRSAQS